MDTILRSASSSVIGVLPRVNTSVLLIAAFLSIGLLSPLPGQAPPGYYDPATGLSGNALKNAVHGIIDDHVRFPYTSGATDTWDILSLAHEDPSNPNNILTVYRNASRPKLDHTSATGWNREHTWPSSYGFTNDGGCNYPFSDCHLLMPADWGYNSSRSNRVFDACLNSCTSYPVDNAPGEVNLGTGNGNTGSWETWNQRRGDVARAILYCAVRYEGGFHGTTGCSEPDLRLTNDRNLITSNTQSNQSIAYMGVLDTLIEWHLADPVDNFERDKNDVVFGFQGNRNPFIDHPEWVCSIWACPGVDTTPPAIPTGLSGTGLDCAIDLTWSPNSEADLAGYRLYRAVTGGARTVLADGLGFASFLDSTTENGISYDYTVSAIDLTGNESAESALFTIMPSGTDPCSPPPSGDPWLNEIHYDNSGADMNEGFEIAGLAGFDLSGYQVIGYNGANSSIYATVNLSGVIPDQASGYGTVWFPMVGMQNGSPDGIALVTPGGAIVEFLSYEGILTANAGPASGLVSTDLGVSESSATPIGNSLPRLGSGSSGPEFTWAPEQPASPGLPNPGQSFGCGVTGPDCNNNGQPDSCDLLLGTSLDNNGNSIPDECELPFARGDSNLDGALDISDPIRILEGLFGTTALLCLDAADANDDGTVNVADVVQLLDRVFSGVPAIPAPGFSCGADPTSDSIDCRTTNCP